MAIYISDENGKLIKYAGLSSNGSAGEGGVIDAINKVDVSREGFITLNGETTETIASIKYATETTDEAGTVLYKNNSISIESKTKDSDGNYIDLVNGKELTKSKGSLVNIDHKSTSLIATDIEAEKKNAYTILTTNPERFELSSILYGQTSENQIDQGQANFFVDNRSLSFGAYFNRNLYGATDIDYDNFFTIDHEGLKFDHRSDTQTSFQIKDKAYYNNKEIATAEDVLAKHYNLDNITEGDITYPLHDSNTININIRALKNDSDQAYLYMDAAQVNANNELTTINKVTLGLDGFKLNDKQIATEDYVTSSVTALKDELLGPGSTEALDTIYELAEAINNGEVGDISQALAAKADKEYVDTAIQEALNSAWEASY